jgi:hypothetical protein
MNHSVSHTISHSCVSDILNINQVAVVKQYVSNSACNNNQTKQYNQMGVWLIQETQPYTWSKINIKQNKLIADCKNIS